MFPVFLLYFALHSSTNVFFNQRVKFLFCIFGFLLCITKGNYPADLKL